ncbi:hypothetical protein E2C01_050580 [Portunus trituberculatus]|uniref:Uncharacterized protein n=1 Tax=Portunus trituberculatus TaxID=210409 RepID=A0A5B7GGD6_PORTR|nr:hypothetical protein [Portunus trituberculatus]
MFDLILEKIPNSQTSTHVVVNKGSLASPSPPSIICAAATVPFRNPITSNTGNPVYQMPVRIPSPATVLRKTTFF